MPLYAYSTLSNLEESGNKRSWHPLLCLYISSHIHIIIDVISPLVTPKIQKVPLTPRLQINTEYHLVQLFLDDYLDILVAGPKSAIQLRSQTQ